MARFFTLQEAEQLLPEVEAAIREAVFLKSEYQEAELELRRASRHIMMAGGAQVDRGRMLSQKARRDTSAAQLKEAIEKIHGLGCQVKDLDTGLVDFPALFRGEEVCLCWKLGETGIRFWHGVNEGFPGRKIIDADFLSNHRGERPN